MKISRKSSSLVAALLVAGLTLSACGDKDKDTGDAGGSDSSSSSSKASTETLTKANFAQVLSDSQIKAKSSHVDMALGAGGQTVKAEGDVAIGTTAADTALTMTMDMGSTMNLDMVMVDEVFYMNMGQVTDGKYIKIDLNDKDNPLAEQYGQIVEQMDPTNQVAQFKDALKSFEKKGEPQTLDGVKAQPYVVTVDTSKIKAFADLPAGAASQVPDTIVYTMFIGPDNLPRRIETKVLGSKTTMNYSKWGEPVDIKAPPAGKISDKDLGDLGVPTPSA